MDLANKNAIADSGVSGKERLGFAKARKRQDRDAATDGYQTPAREYAPVCNTLQIIADMIA